MSFQRVTSQASKSLIVFKGVAIQKCMPRMPFFHISKSECNYQIIQKLIYISEALSFLELISLTFGIQCNFLVVSKMLQVHTDISFWLFVKRKDIGKDVFPFLSKFAKFTENLRI